MALRPGVHEAGEVGNLDDAQQGVELDRADLQQLVDIWGEARPPQLAQL